MVSRESAIDNLVLQNLQQPDNHQNSHVQEVLQQWVGLHFKPSRQVGGHFAPVEVRLGQIEFDEVVVVVQNQVDKECELNVDVARGEQLAEFICDEQPAPAGCLVICPLTNGLD